MLQTLRESRHALAPFAVRELHVNNAAAFLSPYIEAHIDAGYTDAARRTQSRGRWKKRIRLSALARSAGRAVGRTRLSRTGKVERQPVKAGSIAYGMGRNHHSAISGCCDKVRPSRSATACRSRRSSVQLYSGPMLPLDFQNERLEGSGNGSLLHSSAWGGDRGRRRDRTHPIRYGNECIGWHRQRLWHGLRTQRNNSGCYVRASKTGMDSLSDNTCLSAFGVGYFFFGVISDKLELPPPERFESAVGIDRDIFPDSEISTLSCLLCSVILPECIRLVSNVFSGCTSLVLGGKPICFLLDSVNTSRMEKMGGLGNRLSRMGGVA